MVMVRCVTLVYWDLYYGFTRLLQVRTHGMPPFTLRDPLSSSHVLAGVNF